MDTDVDLIPGEFRQWRQRTTHLWYTLAITLLCTVALGAFALALTRHAAEVEQANAKFATQAALAEQQRAQLEVLDQRYQALQDEWALLRGLRSGASIDDLFVLIDRALVDQDVWFEDWRLRRAGVLVPATMKSVETGYFIVIPTAQEGQRKDDWQVRTTMRIRGQARDHGALSRFVRGLYDQPDVLEVKLNRTSRHDYQQASAVDFELSITLNSTALAEG